jgi:acetolactate synthase I/II/III large subunit
MRITGAQAVVRLLECHGVTILFGYPGGAILPVYDALRESSIKHVLVRHEQNAAHAASGYARVTGKVGVCIATSGPGATNLITGIATAYMDSIPMVIITGQVPLSAIGRDFFQEVDIVGATVSLTKHNYVVKKAVDLPRIVREAFHIASTGRPGPVLIDLPKDIAEETFAYKDVESINIKSYQPTYQGHPKQIERIMQALAQSKQPVVCAGGGIISADAASELRQLAETCQIPVATTLMGIGAFPKDHPLSLGMLGFHGTGCANLAIDNADFIFILGARAGDRAIRKIEEFGRKAMVVHIDIDPAEIGKNVGVSIPMVGDLKIVLQEILRLAKPRSDSGWLSKIARWREEKPLTFRNDGKLKPQYVLQQLCKVTTPTTIIATDVGQHQMWAGAYYCTKIPRTFLTSGGMGTMGYGLPAAIGAQMGKPEEPVILVTGDGSFQMNMAEMATAMQENLPVKIIILNNNTLGMVRELQTHFQGKRYYQVHMQGNPDFVKLAEAYGISARRITENNDVLEALETMFKSPGPMLLEFIVDAEENVVDPMVQCPVPKEMKIL